MQIPVVILNSPELINLQPLFMDNPTPASIVVMFPNVICVDFIWELLVISIPMSHVAVIPKEIELTNIALLSINKPTFPLSSVMLGDVISELSISIGAAEHVPLEIKLDKIVNLDLLRIIKPEEGVLFKLILFDVISELFNDIPKLVHTPVSSNEPNTLLLLIILNPVIALVNVILEDDISELSMYIPIFVHVPIWKSVELNNKLLLVICKAFVEVVILISGDVNFPLCIFIPVVDVLVNIIILDVISELFISIPLSHVPVVIQNVSELFNIPFLLINNPLVEGVVKVIFLLVMAELSISIQVAHIPVIANEVKLINLLLLRRYKPLVALAILIVGDVIFALFSCIPVVVDVPLNDILDDVISELFISIPVVQVPVVIWKLPEFFATLLLLINNPVDCGLFNIILADVISELFSSIPILHPFVFVKEVKLTNTLLLSMYKHLFVPIAIVMTGDMIIPLSICIPIPDVFSNVILPDLISELFIDILVSHMLEDILNSPELINLALFFINKPLSVAPGNNILADLISELSISIPIMGCEPKIPKNVELINTELLRMCKPLVDTLFNCMVGTVNFELSIFIHVTDVVNNCISVLTDISELVISMQLGTKLPGDILNSSINNLPLVISKPLFVASFKVILADFISELFICIPVSGILLIVKEVELIKELLLIIFKAVSVIVFKIIIGELILELSIDIPIFASLICKVDFVTK